MSERTPVIDRPHALVEGQRLDQPTFHALYEATPPGTRAELINGVVHMPSQVGHAHGVAHIPVLVWLDYYAEKTLGVEAMDNATTILGWKSELQPDGSLRILADSGGRTWLEHGFVHGVRNSSSKFQRRHDTSTSDQKRLTMSRQGCSSTSCMRSTLTRSSGSARIKAC